MTTLVWFRRDLRLFDNPALSYAVQQGQIIPVFIQPVGVGAASQWWLHHSLVSLSASLAEQDCQLILRSGDPIQLISELVGETGVQQVVWNRDYSPAGLKLEHDIEQSLKQMGVTTQSFNGQLLLEPEAVSTKQGTRFKVFTPYWRACRQQITMTDTLTVPTIQSADLSIKTECLNDWQLCPTKPNWASDFPNHWQPGEAGAQQAWASFRDQGVNNYHTQRDVPSLSSTSKLSPHLSFGEISVRQLWAEMQQSQALGDVPEIDANKFLSELGWREFSHYLMFHFPEILSEPFNKRFSSFPWQADDHVLGLWQQGKTGYPIVDAGMRELWVTGYMHNRVRMIVASFLTKHCLIDWHDGMDWFWDTLLDADIANNTVSWQWVAGCGADAAPYFRIFNPILQGKRFDPQGEYVKKWLPELNDLPDTYLHEPWQAPPLVLQAAGVTLGLDYPEPLIQHEVARARALAVYKNTN